MTTNPRETPPTPPHFTIDIPGINEIIVWRKPTPQEARQMAARQATRNPAVPQPLGWIPGVINWLDDIEDLISTSAPFLYLFAKLIAPRLIPGIGWALTAANLANALVQILGAPLVGRLPKAKAFQDLIQANTTRKLGPAANLFPRSTRAAVGYLLEAGQAMKTLTGYGLQLGGIMSAVSETIWALIRSPLDQKAVVVRGPVSTDPLAAAFRTLFGAWKWTPYLPWLDRERQLACLFFTGAAAAYIEEHAKTPPDIDRIQPLINGWMPEIEHPRRTWYEVWGDPDALRKQPIAPDTNIKPFEPHPTKDWIAHLARQYQRAEHEWTTYHPLDDALAHMAARASVQSMLIGKMADSEHFDPTAPLTPRERWTLRVIESGLLPPPLAQVGDMNFYHWQSADYGRSTALNIITTPGVTARPLPRTTLTRTRGRRITTLILELHQRSAAYYSGRLKTYEYWGPPPVAWARPITIDLEPGKPIIPLDIWCAFPAYVDVFDLGPYAPLAAILDLFGQAVDARTRLDNSLPTPASPAGTRPHWWNEPINWYFRRGPVRREYLRQPLIARPPRHPWYTTPQPVAIPYWAFRRGATHTAPTGYIVPEWTQTLYQEPPAWAELYAPQTSETPPYFEQPT